MALQIDFALALEVVILARSPYQSEVGVHIQITFFDCVVGHRVGHGMNTVFDRFSDTIGATDVEHQAGSQFDGVFEGELIAVEEAEAQRVEVELQVRVQVLMQVFVLFNLFLIAFDGAVDVIFESGRETVGTILESKQKRASARGAIVPFGDELVSELLKAASISHFRQDADALVVVELVRETQSASQGNAVDLVVTERGGVQRSVNAEVGTGGIDVGGADHELRQLLEE